eukprot:jgi/Botrbrau1/16835/Bobra.150_2s0059.1
MAKPMRVCERKLHKFKDCGRGEELTEVMTEEIVDHNYRGRHDGNIDLNNSFKVPPPPREVLNSEVGESVEHFMSYADDLKREVLQEHSPGGRGDWAGSPPQHRSYWKSPGWLRSWFGFRREAQCSPGRGRPNESLWEDYAQYFQDV